MRILVCDDSVTARRIVCETVQKLGHDPVATEDGFEAWGIFEKEYFPVLITDLEMPRIDGNTLTMLVRARPHPKYTYVLLLTAHGGKENYMEAIRAGADDFITKPFDEEHLAARLFVAQRIVGLQDHTKRLEAYLSVCSYCKDVRNDDGYWVKLDQMLPALTDAQMSHGVCPTCYSTRVKPELERLGIAALEKLGP